MQVGGAPGVAVPGVKEAPDRAVVGDGVGLRQDRGVPVAALLVGGELAAQVVLVLALRLLLDRVGAGGVGLPGVDDGARERLVQDVPDLAVNEDRGRGRRDRGLTPRSLRRGC